MSKVGFSDHFERLIPFFICSLEVNARVPQKVATIRHLRGKKPSNINIFYSITVKQKRRTAAKLIHSFCNLHTFFNYISFGSDCTRLVKLATICHFRGKKSQEK